ncbi:alpha/beta hydrolase fold domain-containing protein [Nocardiopsis coralliicola]
MTTDEVETPTGDAPRGRGYGDWVLRAAVLLAAAAVAALLAAVVAPVLPRWGLTVSMMVTGLSPLMAVPALAAGALLALALRRRLRWAALVSGATAAAALAAAVLPWAAAERAAAEHGVDLSPSAHLQIRPDPGPPDDSFTYADVGGTPLKADVWRPADGEGNGAAVVWAHGGGWVGGQRGENAPLHRYLTERGYTVFDVDYRLSPPPSWDKQAGDVKCALGKVREKAADFGVDPAAVSVGGASAGGNLALLAGYTIGDGEYPPTCDVSEQPVRSAVSFYGPTDTADMVRSGGVPEMGRAIAPMHYGALPSAAPERYAATSPAAQVDGDVPPTLIVQGTRDHVVPAHQAGLLSRELEEAGAEHTTVLVPWADHGFDWAWGSWQSQLAAGATEAFLADRSGAAPVRR